MLSVHFILVRFQIKKQAMVGCKLQSEKKENKEECHTKEPKRERERAGIRESNMEKNGKLNRKFE